jgi:tight adherence protein C
MAQILSILVQVAIFAGVVAAVVILTRIAERQVDIRRRLGVVQATATPTSASVIKTNTVSHPLLRWIEDAFLNDTLERDKLRRSLIQAGFEHPSAPVWYVAIRFGLAIGLPLLFIALTAVGGRNSGGPMAILAPLVLTGVGLIGPRAFINSRAKARRTKVEHQFPDALDLMVVCVEAGLGIDAAFQRVGVEVAKSHPEISHEFDVLSDELAAGRTRADALKSMAVRLDVESIRAFVALLVQTEALGVSIAQGLRTYSAEMRETRFMKAEEKAMRIPVLMTMPLVACFMPVIVVALLLPPAIDMIRTLLPTLNGQR